MPAKLLDRFQALFEGQKYNHRVSTHGDRVAQYIYEDLFDLGQSRTFVDMVNNQRAVLSTTNTTHGVRHRRGDGTLGIAIPEDPVVEDAGFHVGRGRIATILIGVEVKILCKAMIRQIDRVKNDITGAVAEFKKSNGTAITVGIAAVNHAAVYTSYEGDDREYRTTGKGRHLHPIQEADKAVAHLERIRGEFDELLILKFEATNRKPFPFQWVDAQATQRDYSSILVRLSSEFDRRF